MGCCARCNPHGTGSDPASLCVLMQGNDRDSPDTGTRTCTLKADLGRATGWPQSDVCRWQSFLPALQLAPTAWASPPARLSGQPLTRPCPCGPRRSVKAEAPATEAGSRRRPRRCGWTRRKPSHWKRLFACPCSRAMSRHCSPAQSSTAAMTIAAPCILAAVSMILFRLPSLLLTHTQKVTASHKTTSMTEQVS